MSERTLDRAFLCFLLLDAALLAWIMLDVPGGLDAAGRGLQIGYGVVGALLLLGLVALYRFSRWRILRLTALAFASLPFLSVLVQIVAEAVQGARG